MPAYADDFSKIEQLRKTAAEANKAGSILTGTSKTFADTIRENFRNHIASQGTNTLAEAVGTTTGQLVSAPADIRARTAEINPLDQDALAARQMAQSLGSLATLGEIDKSRTDTVEGVIGAGTNRLVAEAEKKKAEATAASDEADNILEVVKFKETQTQNQFDQWYKKQQLALAGEAKTAGERDKKLLLSDLKAEASEGTTLSDLMTRYADKLSQADIVNAYKEIGYYGPPKEPASQLGRMYDSAKNGSGAGDLLGLLKTDERKIIQQKTATHVDSNAILNKMAERLGNQAPTFFKALTDRDFGKLAKLTVPFRNDAEIRGLLEGFQAQVRQQYYGSAFTETEAKLADRWLAKSDNQSNEIWWKLMAQSNLGKQGAETYFKSRGITQGEIDNYWNQFNTAQSSGNSQDEWVDTGNTK